MKIIIRGEKVYLREIRTEDINNEYINWLNNPKINQFLESRFERWTTKKLRDYIDEVKKNKDNYIFAIILKDSNKHIGNIKIGPINKIHKFAHIGIMIGDQASWGKGYGSETMCLATKFAFTKLHLNKLIAGIYSNNIGSYKAFLKAGFKKAGCLRRHRLYKGHFVDEILVEKIKNE